MKKVLSLILALAMVFALVACGEKQPATDGDASSDGDKPARGNVIMTFGTADTGGSMYPAGAAVSQVWTNNVEGVKCNTQTSTGSFQNCQDVSTGEVDVAVAPPTSFSTPTTAPASSPTSASWTTCASSARSTPPCSAAWRSRAPA